MSTPDVLLPAGYRLCVHETLDSTNSEALRRAGAGEEGGLWVWAHSQRTGRGRLGRRWVSLAGNLFATLLLRPNCRQMHMAQLSLVAGLALHDAVAGLAERDILPHLALKWPNDLLHDGMKLGGVLLESKLSAGSVPAVAMGVGVNLAAHPDVTDYPATDLARHGISATPARVLEGLAAACDEWLGVWNDGSGFAHIREAWMARSLPANAPLQVKLTDSASRGIYGGLDEDGALILILDDGTKKRITTGDVFPL
ncbi:bifunctional ligase/repressor BirA [bacterium BMS3Bbin10]|nr:bifunctional ligase/repressor BirA [bacterium BMS3Bbin10]